METIIEWILPAMIAVLVISGIAQIFWAYALSAIAQKTEQSELMQLLAWIPLLQMAPVIVAGGGSVGQFLLASVGLFLGALALGAVSAVLGGAFGSLVGGLGIAAMVLLCIVYFARLSWNTAVNRDLPGWVGLLLFVPLVNFFVYPYIAFHDGWVSPNKAGLAIAVVLAIGSTAPSLETIRMLQANGGFPAAFASLGEDSELVFLDEEQARSLEEQMLAQLAAQLGEMEGTIEVAPLENPAEDAPPRSRPTRALEPDQIVDPEVSIRALFELKDRFESLERFASPDNLRVDSNRASARELARALRIELEARRQALDRATFEDLKTHLSEIESQIESPSRVAQTADAQRRSGGVRYAGQPGPASMSSHSDRNTAPTNPFPVRPAEDCPDGSELKTQTGEQGEEEWCQQHAELGGLRHGWYARYRESGQPESMGEYEHGLRVGVWTRFYPSGEVRAQAQFRAGLQHGWLVSFDESGKSTKAVRFEEGIAAR